MSIRMQSFSWALCVCVSIYVQWMQAGDKAESSYSLYIVVRLRENTQVIYGRGDDAV